VSIWIPSPNRYIGRLKPLKWIVWHSTEGDEKPGAARPLAMNWFALPSAQVSAHVIADDGTDDRYRDGIVECVKPGDTAWHCANGNASGYGVEVIGKAGQSGVQWTDLYSRAALRNAARWVAGHPALQHIPRRFLTDEQLRAGELGHITHVQVSRVLGGTTHTDPGANFPRDLVMAYVNDLKEPPAMSNLDADAAYSASQLAGPWPSWGGGTGESLTLVDYARRSNVETRQARVQLDGLKVDVAAVKAAVERISVGGVDLDALAAKVADVLAARLAG
jgi:hypothetical protein